MIQDISPYTFDNSFERVSPQEDDYIIIFKKDSILAKISEDKKISYPRFSDIGSADVKYNYLFALTNSVGDKIRFFLARNFDKEILEHLEETGYEFTPQRNTMYNDNRHMAYAGTVSCQLARWYENNQRCGICGKPMHHATKERMLYCEDCQVPVYPRINPVVIVGVRNGEKLLLTKYAGGSYRHYALVAGFSEAGESIEQTVCREVFEETGVRVKNLEFYKSQPWAMSDSLLFGFFCDLDGSDEITLQDGELSVGEWIDRSDIEDRGDTVSLTSEMMRVFKLGLK